MRRFFSTLVLSAGLALLAAPVASQVAVAPSPRGWIGISYEFQTTRDGNRVVTLNRVTDVMDGSPAARAGVRPGDVLVSVNGMDWNQAHANAIQGLRPGDQLRLVVEREGRRQELHVTAGSRPSDETIVRSWHVTFNPDSMVERMVQAMDSLRIRITEGEGMEFRVTGDGRLAGDSATWSTDPSRGMRIWIRESDPDRVVTIAPFDVRVPEGLTDVMVSEVRAPFTFSFFRGEGQDSLYTAMDELNKEIRGARARRAARFRDLALKASGNQGRIDGNDAELRRLDQELRRLGERADVLRASMEEASRAGALAWTRSLPGLPTTGATAEVVAPRPMAPYVLGQNRAAGAEVVELRPELAEYFQVDGGVLVIDVAPGTPANTAGIQPGDVLTHVGGSAVRSMADLRKGLAMATGDLPVTLVRKGRRLQVLLGR